MLICSQLMKNKNKILYFDVLQIKKIETSPIPPKIFHEQIFYISKDFLFLFIGKKIPESFRGRSRENLGEVSRYSVTVLSPTFRRLKYSEKTGRKLLELFNKYLDVIYRTVIKKSCSVLSLTSGT